MIRVLIPVIVLLALGLPALAGNARSDRTARSFRQDQIRRQRINARWTHPQRRPPPQWVSPRIYRSPDPFVILHAYPHHRSIPPGYFIHPTPLIRRPWPAGPRR